MIIYHRTDAAEKIISEGFRDGVGRYLTSQEWTGVWVSDRPLDANSGAHGKAIIWLDVPEELIAKAEWIEERKYYREFLVPADVLNRHGPPQYAVYCSECDTEFGGDRCTECGAAWPADPEYVDGSPRIFRRRVE